MVGKPKAAGVPGAVHNETSKFEIDSDLQTPVELYQKEELTFTHLAEIELGPLGRTLVEISLIVGQLGCMMAYLIYIGTLGNYFVPTIPEWAWVFMFLPTNLAVCQLREIKLLMDWSALGVLASIFGMISLFVICMNKVASEGVAPLEYDFKISTFPSCFGIMFFAMEGIQVMLPVAHKMSRPEDYPSMLLYVVTAVAISYMCLAVVGYMAYGSKVLAPMTDNMDDNDFTDFIRFSQGLVVLVSFPIQAFPVAKLLDVYYPENQTLSRAIIVLIPTVVAIVFPFMGEAMGMIGGLAMTGLGCVFPILMYLQHFSSSITDTQKAILWTCMSVGGMIGTLATIESAVQMFDEL